MEEKKMNLPKPPKELRKAEQKAEAAPEVEQVFVPEPEVAPQVFEEQPKVAKKKRKLNFEPVTNWIGLFVSLAALGVFVFLLVI